MMRILLCAHNLRIEMSKKSIVDFKSISELEGMTIDEKQKMLDGIEFLISKCELSRTTIIENCDIDGVEVDKNWLKKINYKIGIKKSQRKMLINHIRVEKGNDLIASFFDVSKIMLPKETFDLILSKAKSISPSFTNEKEVM